MGTNYYRRRLPTEESFQHVVQLLREKKFSENSVDEGKMNAIDLIKEFEEGVHLCKISYGWQVCFDHNWGKYYMPTRECLDRFLREPDTYIEDEYGEIYTPERFWEEVDEHNASERSIYTAKRYKEEYPGEYILDRPDEIQRCRELFGVEPEADEFVSKDGLRFATYSDFS